jgi:hypothetical protein
MNVDILIYSHSDMDYMWSVTVNQMIKHNIDNISVYWGCNKTNNYKFPNDWKIIYYDENDAYSNRVCTLLNQIKSEYILYIHEDWIPCENFYNNIFNDMVKIMKNSSFNHLRSYKNHGKHNNNQLDIELKTDLLIDKNYKILKIPINSSNCLSLQPALWKTSFLKDFFNNILGVSYRNTESNGQKYIKLNINHMYYIAVNNSKHSPLFPHIHSISRGKWVKDETLNVILNSYNVNF